MVRANRLPAMRLRAGRFAWFNRPQRISAPARSVDRFALGIESNQRFGAGEVSEAIPPFAVFGFVVDDPAVLEILPKYPSAPTSLIHGNGMSGR